jgi:retinol dehydrogenase-12
MRLAIVAQAATEIATESLPFALCLDGVPMLIGVPVCDRSIDGPRAAPILRCTHTMTTERPSAALSGRVCMVTGATSGIGRETARALARMGATLVIVARDPERARTTLEAIAQESPHAIVHALPCDLSSQAAIRALATSFQARFDRLHVLVNNAGAILGERRLTADGIEATFATNHLGYFLLTQLLEDMLVASGTSHHNARVVNVASEVHRIGRLVWDDLSYEHRPFSSFGAYAASKLANVAWSAELARRLKGRGVTSNAVHPGVVGSSFGRSGSKLMQLTYRLFGPLMRSAEQGARSSIHVASSPSVEGQTGLYFSGIAAIMPSRTARDPAVAQRLWQVSEELIRRPFLS